MDSFCLPSLCHSRIVWRHTSCSLSSAFHIEDHNQFRLINLSVALCIAFLSVSLLLLNLPCLRFLDQYSQCQIFVTLNIFYQDKHQSFVKVMLHSESQVFRVVVSQLRELNPTAMALTNLINQAAYCHVNSTYTAPITSWISIKPDV